MSEPPRTPAAHDTQGSSTGLDPKLGGLLAYLLGFVSAVVLLILEKSDRSIRFHAYQSILVSAALFVLHVGAQVVPVLGPLVGWLIQPVGFILWVALMIQAFRGERWKLPYVGDWAEEQARAR